MQNVHRARKEIRSRCDCFSQICRFLPPQLWNTTNSAKQATRLKLNDALVNLVMSLIYLICSIPLLAPAKMDVIADGSIKPMSRTFKESSRIMIEQISKGDKMSVTQSLTDLSIFKSLRELKIPKTNLAPISNRLLMLKIWFFSIFLKNFIIQKMINHINFLLSILLVCTFYIYFAFTKLYKVW